jgi:hypothetical protein
MRFSPKAPTVGVVVLCGRSRLERLPLALASSVVKIPYPLQSFIMLLRAHAPRIAGTMSPTKTSHFPASAPSPSLLMP